MRTLAYQRLMRCLIFGSLIVATPVLAAPPPGKTAEEQGRHVFVTQDEMDAGFHDAVVQMTMKLINAAGQKSVRKMTFRSFEIADDGDKTLMTFEEPRDIKGTGLLSYEHIDREDDQWLYLPALKRVKRIASKNKSGSFVGSEFSYEDLASFEPEKYDYRYLREDALEEKPVWVVERDPKDPNSGYTKIIAWVEQSNHQTLKQEFFDRKGSPLKTQTNRENTLYLDKHWRPTSIVMENVQTQKKTILEFVDWKFKQGLDESFFTKRSLERQR
jgi:outer membrane lipoprotein-sorting protein